VRGMFFDLHIHGDEKVAGEAFRLGYTGVSIVNYSDEHHQNVMDSKKVKGYPKITTGVEIIANNVADLKKQIHRFRRSSDILIVHGGNIKMNRAACEDQRVDIISHPYCKRRDSGINHVLARKASANKVAVEININYILKTRMLLRSKVISQFREIIKLHRKFNFPLIITSDAHSIYDLRSPQDLIALTGRFGMTREESIDALSKSPVNIIERSMIRKDVVEGGARIMG
jgi:ribonuclease P/MRP protein subunit RPP1